MTRPASRAASRLRLTAFAVAAALLSLLQLSCATNRVTPQASQMPAARAALRPEYRVFYDELQDYGDWVLIEPFGFVFRPKTRFNNWSPYFDGFWSPSDSYGWVWVSGEPFGWATYHYGAWFNDDYQGWVWVPGLEWAPAWVAWTGNDNYVGWAALTPGGGAAGGFHVVPRGDLGATDLRSHVLTQEKATRAIATAQPIENYAEVEHVMVNRGPAIEWVEQVRGPLTRARLEDVIARRGFGRVPAGAPATADGPPASIADDKPVTAPTTSPPATSNEFRKTAESVAAEARTVMQQKQSAPDVISRLKMSDVAPRPSPGSMHGTRPAKRDSVR